MKWAIRPQKHMRKIKMHISKWKLPIQEGYVLYDSNYVMFWYRQNYGGVNRAAVTRVWVGEKWTENTQDVRDSENTLYDIIMMDTYHLYICPSPQNVQHQVWP